MRPIPIEDEDLCKIMERNGVVADRITMSAPNGDLLDDDIRPVEVARYEGALGRAYALIIKLDEADIERLKVNDGKILMTMVGSVVPFDHEVLE